MACISSGCISSRGSSGTYTNKQQTDDLCRQIPVGYTGMKHFKRKGERHEGLRLRAPRHMQDPQLRGVLEQAATTQVHA